MKKLRWQLLIIFLTGLVVGVLLLSEQPEKAPVFAPEPEEGGVYVEALIGKFQRLNPVLDFFNPVDQDLDRLIFSRLIVFEERGIPQTELAESWGVNKDGTIYTFTLRGDAKWHDGQPVVSEDIVFTINMLREGEGIVPEDLRQFWANVEVQSLSETTLQFLLPEPFAPFLDYLSFGILPAHLLGDLTFQQLVNSGYNLQPVGSGPYRFDGLVIEDNNIQGVVLSVNRDYFGKIPFIEQLVFRYYATPQEGLTAYKDGLVQGISKLDSTVLPQVLVDPQLALYTARQPEFSMVIFNLKDQQVEFFQDSIIRKAFLLGLNRQRIVNRVFNGQAILASGPILPGTWAYYDGLQLTDFNRQKAIEMIKNTGFVISGENTSVRAKEGVELRFELLYPDTQEHRQVAELIQQDWEALGAAVEIRGVPYNQLITDHLEPRSFQAVLVDLNLASTPDPDPYPFWDQVQATGGQNYSQWDDDVVSDYLEQARITIDLAERALLYRNFQVLFDEELPALPLYYPVYTFAISGQVQGVQVGPMFNTSDRFSTVTNWFLLNAPAKEPLSTPTAAVKEEGG
jgi:peptide/nickel transport system substrate-binding protein